MTESQTTLFDALFILARAHTCDDAEVGFCVVSPPYDTTEVHEYLNAWRVIREQLHMPTKREDYR